MAATPEHHLWRVWRVSKPEHVCFWHGRHPLKELTSALEDIFPRYPSHLPQEAQAASTSQPQPGGCSAPAAAPLQPTERAEEVQQPPEAARRRANKRFVLLEYVMLRGVNDRPADAQVILRFVSVLTFSSKLPNTGRAQVPSVGTSNPCARKL